MSPPGDPFDVIRAATPSPVVVEIPHAGLAIDERASVFTRVPERAAQARAVEADADLGADLVWEETEHVGVTRVVARTSRYVIDLNTDPRPPPRPPFYEVDPAPTRILRRSHAGLSWVERAMPRDEWSRRVEEISEPYHRAIATELADARRRHGAACLVGAHTFHDPKRGIADVVLGTLDGRAAPPALRDAIAEVARERGFSVALEAPFRGGYALTRHAQPADGVFGVQLEIARRLVTGGEGAERPVDPDALSRLQALARALVPALVVTLASLRAPR